MSLCCEAFRLQAGIEYLLSIVQSFLQIIKTTAKICDVYITKPNYNFMQSNFKTHLLTE